MKGRLSEAKRKGRLTAKEARLEYEDRRAMESIRWSGTLESFRERRRLWRVIDRGLEARELVDPRIALRWIEEGAKEWAISAEEAAMLAKWDAAAQARSAGAVPEAA